jgi:hypothetical protein
VFQLVIGKSPPASPLGLRALKGIGKGVSVQAITAYRGNTGIAPPILNLGTRRRRVVSFMLPSLSLSKKVNPVPTGQEAGWEPQLVWTILEKKNLLPLP